MSVVDEGGEAPTDLRLAWLVLRYHIPPSQVFDEDYDLLSRMDAAHNVYSVMSRFRAMRGAEIHLLTDPERRILRVLRDNHLI